MHEGSRMCPNPVMPSLELLAISFATEKILAEDVRAFVPVYD